MPDPITIGLLTVGATALGAGGTWAGVGQTHRKNQKKAERYQDRELPPVAYGVSITRNAGAQNGGRVEYRADGSVSVWGSQPGDRAFSSETTNITPMIMGPVPPNPFVQPLARPSPPMTPYQQPPLGLLPLAAPPPRVIASPYPMGGPYGGYAPPQIQAAPAQYCDPYGVPPPSYEQSEKRHHSVRRWKN